ncbi:hypothetical protein C0993_006253, partial [Termitomyces sp. T159_Od127]
MNNLGYTLQSAGKLQEAEEIQREVLAAQQAVLGNNHPDTFVSMDNLGFTLQRAGKLQEAEEIQREVLAAQQA